MMSKQAQRIRFIFDILLSISIAVAGICFIWGCLSIYSAGEHPYSREAVAEAFATIAIPVYICLVLVVMSIIINIILPDETKKDKMFKPYGHILERLVLKKDLSGCEPELKQKIDKERKFRHILLIILISVVAYSCVDFFSYALDASNYSEDITASVIDAVQELLPCFTVFLIYGVCYIVFTRNSMKREIDLLKLAPNADEAVKEDIEETREQKKRSKHLSALFITRTVMIAVAIVAIVYGLIAGGTMDVLTKAVNICTECIGLG